MTLREERKPLFVFPKRLLKDLELTTKFYITSELEIETTVKRFAETYLVPERVQRLGVAVSGGADSIALLHLLLPLCSALEITVFILHLNHGLRKESQAEAAFVEQLAQSYKTDFTSRSLDLKNRPQDNRSMEMAARDERIRFYTDCADALALDAIATGHHADDLCENLLLRLARGSGIAGLSGMRPSTALKSESEANSEIRIVRPLLNIASTALRAWLTMRNFKWHEDLSNLDRSIPRNNIRHTIMPLLRANLSQEIDVRLCQSIATLREDESLLNEIARERLAAVQYNRAILVSALLQQPLSIQRRALRLWLFDHKLPTQAGFQRVNDLLVRCAETGIEWSVQLDRETLIRFDGEFLSIDKPRRAAVLPESELRVNATTPWGDFEIKVERSHGIEAESQGINIYPASCSLSAEKLQGETLIVRQRREGDRIAPTGLQGSKKIKDVLIDAKIPRYERDTMPIITCADKVLWIPGYRISRDYAVATKTAQSIQITVSRML